MNNFFENVALEDTSSEEISELLDVEQFENMWLSLGEDEGFVEQGGNVHTGDLKISGNVVLNTDVTQHV